MQTATKERFQKLIDENPIMIFAKGTRSFPQCGFSARVVQIFESLGKPFEVYNVLEALDESRDALSAIVEEQTGGPWRTTPQVFIGGSFVGGCDIVTELYVSGELQAQVEKAFADSSVPTD